MSDLILRKARGGGWEWGWWMKEEKHRGAFNVEGRDLDTSMPGSTPRYTALRYSDFT